jgi:hypothetical protein
MKVFVDLSKVTAADQIEGENDHETGELNSLLRQASEYLESFAWCGGIKAAYMGIGVGGVVGVFLFKITPIGEDVDEWVWVVVGDLPAAFITAEDAPNPACALDAYIGAMEKWVEAARTGASVNDLIPVNVPASPENAQRLDARLRFLDKEILANYREDLKQPAQRVE